MSMEGQQVEWGAGRRGEGGEEIVDLGEDVGGSGGGGSLRKRRGEERGERGSDKRVRR